MGGLNPTMKPISLKDDGQIKLIISKIPPKIFIALDKMILNLHRSPKT